MGYQHSIRKRLYFSVLFAFLFANGCSSFSSNIRLERIDEKRAIVKYDRGALIESNGEEEARKAMSQHCSPKEYKILVSGERVSGEKKWTRTIVFECVENR